MIKKKTQTAEELLAALAQDKEFLAQADRVASAHQRAVNDGLSAREQVNSELRLIGIPEDYAKFLESSTPDAAFPVLLKHLRAGKLPGAELGVLARCFGQPSAAPYWDDIVLEFKSRMLSSDNDPVKQGLAIALGRMCVTREQLAELYELIEDNRFGAVRVALMDKVRRTDIPLFLELFERLVERDEQVRAEILSWRSYWKRNNPSILERWKGRR